MYVRYANVELEEAVFTYDGRRAKVDAYVYRRVCEEAAEEQDHHCLVLINTDSIVDL